MLEHLRVKFKCSHHKKVIIWDDKWVNLIISKYVCYQIITLYTLNLHSVICPLYLIIAEKEKNLIGKQWKSVCSPSSSESGWRACGWMAGWTQPSWRRPVSVTIVTDKTDDSAFAVIWGTTSNILIPKWNKIWVVPWDQISEGSCQSRKYCLRVIFHHFISL